MPNYPVQKLDPNYRDLYKHPIKLSDTPYDQQLIANPIPAPFGTALGRNPDDWVDDFWRIGQKEGPVGGYYIESHTPLEQLPLQGAPNVDQVWTGFPDIGTGYLSPAQIQQNQPLVFDDWGTVMFVRRLGLGGFGEVWLTHVTKVGQQQPDELACKVLNLQQSNRLSKSISILFTDARILLGLDHPNVCTILDIMPVGDSQSHFPFNRLLLFMEYCPDVLSQRLDQNPNGLPETDCINLLVGALKGLKYLHDNRVVHLDIKPENILIDSNNQTKLADFGLSVRFGKNHRKIIPANLFLGTPGYMAPEMANNNYHGVKGKPCDVYSMGRTLCRTLVGNQNFNLLQNHATMINFFRQFTPGPSTPVPLIQPIGSISQQLAKLCLSMLSGNPSHRPDINKILANPIWPGYIPRPSFWTRTKQFFTRKS